LAVCYFFQIYKTWREEGFLEFSLMQVGVESGEWPTAVVC